MNEKDSTLRRKGSRMSEKDITINKKDLHVSKNDSASSKKDSRESVKDSLSSKINSQMSKSKRGGQVSYFPGPERNWQPRLTMTKKVERTIDLLLRHYVICNP
jgi:hypothetical protein